MDLKKDLSAAHFGTMMRNAPGAPQGPVTHFLGEHDNAYGI
jgi:hypothetical protein